MARPNRGQKRTPVPETDRGVTPPAIRESADGRLGFLIQFFHRETASTLVEYGVLVGMIAMAAVVVVATFGLDVAGLFSAIGDGFDTGGQNWGGVIN